MHMGEAVSQAHPVIGRPASGLDFLWLELTNRCNLQCVHCYTESHPHSGERDLLTREDYESLMVQAFSLGCRKVQFIGGEPQLNPHFGELLAKAKTLGFEFIEVFSNLTRLNDETLDYAARNGICFATSVYSDEPAGHDAITKVKSSHARTVSNLKKLIEAGIATRAAIILIDQDPATVGRTKRFLSDLGVGHVNYGEVRQFGRGERLLARTAELAGLCGHCWAGKLCIAPDGEAYPCVMARQWSVGNVLSTQLAEIVDGEALGDMRRTIFDAVWAPKMSAASERLRSIAQCPPKVDCAPVSGAPDCAPEVQPESEPEKYPGGDPAEKCSPCPQSCVPDTQAPPCEPNPCPQSCTPFEVE